LTCTFTRVDDHTELSQESSDQSKAEDVFPHGLADDYAMLALGTCFPLANLKTGLLFLTLSFCDERCVSTLLDWCSSFHIHYIRIYVVPKEPLTSESP
jgi:hypothetical protein